MQPVQLGVKAVVILGVQDVAIHVKVPVLFIVHLAKQAVSKLVLQTVEMVVMVVMDVKGVLHLVKQIAPVVVVALGAVDATMGVLAVPDAAVAQVSVKMRVRQVVMVDAMVVQVVLEIVILLVEVDVLQAVNLAV